MNVLNGPTNHSFSAFYFVNIFCFKKSRTMTDILAQKQSEGIFYEPYEHDFKLCIQEEPNVQGRNERYEFRCDAHLSCCGRVCCVPAEEPFPIPLWLLIPLLLLLLLLLLALLYLLYRLCCRRKRGGKEVVKRSTATSRRRTTRPFYGDEGAYRSIERDDDRERLFRDRASYAEMPNGHAKVEEKAVVEHQRGGPFRRSFHEEETFEEEFHEEIEVEEKKGADVVMPSPEPIVVEERRLLPPPSPPKPTPPRVIPSPVEELQLEKPRPIRAVERELLGSRQSLATVVSRRSESPQRAQHAFYRPVMADPVDELQLPVPARLHPQFGDTRDLLGRSEKPVEKVVDAAEANKAQHMFVRPGFDNIPAY